MLNLDFYTFNTLESFLWFGLGFVVAFFIANDVPKRYRFLGVYTSVTLVIFGLSDVIENMVGGFWHANEWLFVLKAVCVLALAIAAVWYIRLRTTDESGL